MRSVAASAPANLNNKSPSLPGPRPIIVTGPTGVGKSAFAVALAEKIHGEVVGADAFQIYAGLPILTAQPDAGLLARIPHHLIGILGLEETCDAARYLRMAAATIQEIQGRGRIPVITGGTGLYLKALTHGLAELPPVEEALRNTIAQMDLPEVLARLHGTDPEAVGNIDARNPARARRALEIVLSTGRPLSASRTSWKSAGRDFAGIVLIRDREELRQRIAANVDSLFGAGVIEEVRQVGNVGPGASRAIGFRDIQAWIAGRMSLDECRARILTSTRRYAKRQLTWCRHQFAFPTLNLTTSPGEPLEIALRLLTGSNT